jgi:hypothetical protein
MKIFKYISLQRLLKALAAAADRMPLTILFSILGFCIATVHIALDDSLSDVMNNLLAKGFITLMVMFALSVAVYLYSESSLASKIHTWRNQLITGVFGVLFYIFFEENLFSNFYTESFVYIAMTMAGVVTAVFVAPFIKNLLVKDNREELSQQEFYRFTYSTILTIIMAFIVGTVSTLLGFLAWMAIDTLFDLPRSFGDFYAYWSAFTYVIVAPMFFIINLKSAGQTQKIDASTDAFYAFLIKYISLPAIAIYFVILYTYTIKVLINFTQWPHGEVAWMVIGFSLFGYFVYTATYVFESFAPARTFRKYFPYLVLPQVVMLFYAIGLRINQYDVTINRYFVVAFGTWLLLISLHFIFSRFKYLGAIPLSLVVFIATVSIGPWGVYSYPETRQLTKLTNSLEQAHMGDGGNIVPIATTQEYSKLSGEIYSSIHYLCNNHGCDSLKPVLAQEMVKAQNKGKTDFNKRKADEILRLEQEINDTNGVSSRRSKAKQEFTIDRLDAERVSEYTPMRGWVMAAALTEALNVHHYNKVSKGMSGELQYITFYVKGGYNDGVVHTTGYDYMLRLDADRSLVQHSKFVNGESRLPLYKAVLDIDDEQLKLSRRGADGEMHIAQSFNLHEEFNKIITKSYTQKLINDKSTTSLGSPKIYISPTARGKELSEGALTFTLIGQELDAKLILNTLSLPNPKWVSKDEDAMTDGEFSSTGMMVDIYGGNRYAGGNVLIKEH